MTAGRRILAALEGVLDQHDQEHDEQQDMPSRSRCEVCSLGTRMLVAARKQADDECDHPLLVKARRCYPALSDRGALERYATYLEEVSLEWAADGDWKEARRCRAFAAEVRELLERR